MTKTLFYAGEPGDGYGWGVCNRYLIRELGKLCTVWHPLEGRYYDGPLFTPIADHDLTPATTACGKPTIGYCFFEYELGPKAVENSKRYDLIFCGSTWCKERLAERGIMHTEVLIQGVDHEIFKPCGKGKGEVDLVSSSPHGEFCIFSGGKFEYRKGQDIVLAAFKLLQDKYPQMRLVTAWHNPWPQLLQSMTDSPHIKIPKFLPHVVDGNDQREFARVVCQMNGIDPSRVFTVGVLPHSELADLMRSTDLGVFPNRCEGGTNLVLMEYLACGKPAIATAGTGHLDIQGYAPLALNQEPNEIGWIEAKPESLALLIEVYCNSQKASDELGGCAAAVARQYTWERAARQILTAVERLTAPS